MKKLILLCAMLGATAFVVAVAPATAIAADRTWVSNTGTDSGACNTPSAACATFVYALTQTSAGGEIDCVNSGDYSNGSTALTLTQSITIDCGTGNVGKLGAGPNNSNAAITINITSAATVILRHLSVNGVAGGAYGIQTTSFTNSKLTVEHCEFYNWGNAGIYFIANSGRGILEISDTSVSSNPGFGLVVSPSSGAIASVVVTGVQLSANADDGLFFQGGGVVAGTLRQSVVAESGTDGIAVASSQAYFTVEESSIVDNLSHGIYVTSAGAIINVGASTIGGNGTGVDANSGSIISFGNNQMSANGTNGSFTRTTPLE